MDGSGSRRAGAHRAPGPRIAPRLVASVVVAAVAGAAVTTLGDWQQTEGARAAGPGVAQDPPDVAVAGFAVEPRTQAGSRDLASRADLTPLGLTSVLSRAGQQAATSLARASAAADLSVAASVDATKAGAQVVARAAWQEAHHPPVLDAWRTSSFGMRWGRLHRGIDYGADVGEPLHAVAAGTVSAAGWTYGLGYHVKITLEDGTVLVYGHLSKVGVSEGELVTAGQRVGKVGSSGSSTGAHLHFEVRVDGEAIDPDPWLADRLGPRHLMPED